MKTGCGLWRGIFGPLCVLLLLQHPIWGLLKGKPPAFLPQRQARIAVSDLSTLPDCLVACHAKRVKDPFGPFFTIPMTR